MKSFALRAEPTALIEQDEHITRKRMVLLLIALAVVFFIGMFTAVRMGELEPTFNGNVDVATLQQDPSAYSLDDADGAAYVIVAKNLEETNAKNVCFSVVFNFRGYDTMGESFILIAALSGSLCILRNPARNKRKAAKAAAAKEAAKHE